VIEDHGDGMVSFTDFEEMQEYMAERSAAAFAAMTAHQRDLLDGREFYWFRYYPEFGEGFTIWGHRESLEQIAARYEAKAAECVAKNDAEGAAEWRDSIVSDRASLADGYVFGEAFSEVEPDGELGSTHAAVMIGVPAEWYAIAASCNWSLRQMALSGEPGMIAAGHIIDAWNTNLGIQLARRAAEEKEEGM
jgi:hypothetical protein